LRDGHVEEGESPTYKILEVAQPYIPIEASNGGPATHKEGLMPRFEEATCSKCGGETVIACPICHGTGQSAGGAEGGCDECDGDMYIECPNCEGSGKGTKNRMTGKSDRKR